MNKYEQYLSVKQTLLTSPCHIYLNCHVVLRDGRAYRITHMKPGRFWGVPADDPINFRGYDDSPWYWDDDGMFYGAVSQGDPDCTVNIDWEATREFRRALNEPV